VQNITTTLKKLFYLWKRSQVPIKQPSRISKIDNLIIFLVCILISIISSYKKPSAIKNSKFIAIKFQTLNGVGLITGLIFNYLLNK